MIARVLLLVSALAPAALAQLTADQRLLDFRHLSDLYARRYAPIEWKREALKIDLLNLAPWIERVTRAKDDLDFYDILVDYVASLNDAHDGYEIPSTFFASLGFGVDLYDGKALVDTIDRARLPLEKYPFEIGDELVSVDGKTAEELITAFLRYSIAGNTRSTRRVAAGWITRRPQYYMPRAHEIGEEAAVVIQRQSGAVEKYSIPWRKTGTPVTVLGASPSPRAAAAGLQSAASRGNLLQKLERYALPRRYDVVGVGSLAPVFTLPENFTQRMGRNRFDSYYSGTYESDGVKIGFIRIPDFEFRSTRDFEREMVFFQENTDGLVIDLMRNPGGLACSGADALFSRISPNDFQGTGVEERVTWLDVLDVKEALDDAQLNGSQDDITLLTMLRDEYEKAFRENRGRTGPMPLCGTSYTRTGRAAAYTKPVLVLIDEMTASAGDIFAALVQDNRRGKLFGYRTMGAGGSPETEMPVGAYTEGLTSITRTLALRKDPVATSDYPTTPYVENVGVRPDIEADYMTRENLTGKGADFVKKFTAALVELAKAGK